METAVVFGVSGQCGSYLAEQLLDKGYRVLGTIRRSSTNTTKERLSSEVLNNKYFSLKECDITDYSSVQDVLSCKPELIFNTAAQSHVATSFQQPSYTFQVDATGVLNILEVMRTQTPNSRLVQFSTSEMFGNNFSHGEELYTIKTAKKTEDHWVSKWQDENTAFAPNSPYAVAKVAAFHLIRLYREAYDLKCASGIMFNMESPRRGENFVTRKITKYIADLVAGKNVGKLKLGNIYAMRDWGFVPDYMDAVYRIATSDVMDDYVVSTGETHTVEEFLELAFSIVHLNWKDYVEFDESLVRPVEVDYLCGCSDKIKNQLGWTPKVKFKELVEIMVKADLKKYDKEVDVNKYCMTVL